MNKELLGCIKNNGGKYVFSGYFYFVDSLRRYCIPPEYSHMNPTQYRNFCNSKVIAVRNAYPKGCAHELDLLPHYKPDAIAPCGFESTPIKKLHIVPSIKWIGSEAFAGCSNLKDICIGKSSVISIGDNAFDNAYRLESVRFPLTLRYIGKEAFMDCDVLHEVAIPQGVIIGEDAFENTPLEGLTNVSFPRFVKAVVSSSTLPDGAKRITQGIKLGKDAFKGTPLEGITSSSFPRSEAVVFSSGVPDGGKRLRCIRENGEYKGWRTMGDLMVSLQHDGKIKISACR